MALLCQVISLKVQYAPSNTECNFVKIAYNTRSKDLAAEISKLKSLIVGGFYGLKDEVIKLKEAIIKNIQDDNARLKIIVLQMEMQISNLETKCISLR